MTFQKRNLTMNSNLNENIVPDGAGCKFDCGARFLSKADKEGHEKHRCHKNPDRKDDMSFKDLNENLEIHDLDRLVSHKIHIDEYKSKMGDDADICVVSLQVTGKEPAADLVNFVEKGYDWVLDADVSTGEKEDGQYLVFIETPRSDDLPTQICELVDDITNLVEHEREDWEMQYHKSIKKYPVTEKDIKNLVPLTPEAYAEKFDQQPIDDMKSAAGLDIDTTAPINEYTDSLRIAAGIK